MKNKILIIAILFLLIGCKTRDDLCIECYKRVTQLAKENNVEYKREFVQLRCRSKCTSSDMVYALNLN